MHTCAHFYQIEPNVELLRNIVALPSRLRHLWKNRKRVAVSTGLQKTLKINGEKARAAGLHTFTGIYNAALYVAIAEHDMSTYSEAILLAPSEWHRKFYARGLAVLLFEVAEDLPTLLGKQYRQWLNDLELDPKWLTRLNTITKSIAAFRKSHEPFLSKIRNYVGAHRDHDAYAQFELLKNLDVLEVFRLAATLSVSIRSLIAFNHDLVRIMGKPSVILSQMARRTA